PCRDTLLSLHDALPISTGKQTKLDDRQYVDGAPYFNAAAFARTAPFTFGNVSRALSDVRNPGNVNWNALIEKRFSITERIALDLDRKSTRLNSSHQIIS